MCRRPHDSGWSPAGLGAGALLRSRVSSRVGRNMPDPVPVILLGQLAVDKACRGRRLGSDLLVDAGRRARSAAGIVGARAVVVQAIDKRAKAFYGRVDLKCDGGRYLIVDAAENFEEPDWQAARAERRCDRESVSREWLRRLLQ